MLSSFLVGPINVHSSRCGLACDAFLSTFSVSVSCGVLA